jgi:hypothetical protein
VFSIVRDEAYFLPYFLNHYRALGVELFLFYDDCSIDGTTEFLCAQPDCGVFTSDLTFSEDFGVDAQGGARRLPQALKETLPDRALPGRWVVTADSDEFLLLPEAAPTLPAFIAALEAAGQPYATAPMVDFYGETLNQRNYPGDLDPFVVNRYFDVGPYFEWEGRQIPTPAVRGLRMRLLLMMLKTHPAACERLFGGDITASGIWKAPLLKHGSGVTRVGDHLLSIAPRTRLGCAIAHFKLYPGLDAKIERALRERQYANQSLEYAFLDACIRLMGDTPLAAPETRRFTGQRSLQEAGLLNWA